MNEFLTSLPALRKIYIEDCKLNDDFNKKIEIIMGTEFTQETTSRYECIREIKQEVTNSFAK